MNQRAAISRNLGMPIPWHRLRPPLFPRMNPGRMRHPGEALRAGHYPRCSESSPFLPCWWFHTVIRPTRQIPPADLFPSSWVTGCSSCWRWSVLESCSISCVDAHGSAPVPEFPRCAHRTAQPHAARGAVAPQDHRCQAQWHPFHVHAG